MNYAGQYFQFFWSDLVFPDFFIFLIFTNMIISFGSNSCQIGFLKALNLFMRFKVPSCTRCISENFRYISEIALLFVFMVLVTYNRPFLSWAQIFLLQFYTKPRSNCRSYIKLFDSLFCNWLLKTFNQRRWTSLMKEITISRFPFLSSISFFKIFHKDILFWTWGLDNFAGEGAKINNYDHWPPLNYKLFMICKNGSRHRTLKTLLNGQWDWCMSRNGML